MTTLTKKLDFAVIFSVKNANPNGDPLNGNRPRTDYENYGEISDVCIKRKIRDRLQESGYSIFVQSDEKKTDGCSSLKARGESNEYGLGKDAFNFPKGKKNGKPEEKATRLKENSKKKINLVKSACEKWFDVRSFGQLFAFGGDDSSEGVSVPIRGPVSLHSAFSIEPVSITSTQITKSVNNEEPTGTVFLFSDSKFCGDTGIRSHSKVIEDQSDVQGEF
ncbi:CRISPR-associated protein, partial [bacterium]|nr:CRISPR-associated protein [bacterium]